MRHTANTGAVFPHAYSFADGSLHPGEAPGLGVDIDEQLAAGSPTNAPSCRSTAGGRDHVPLVRIAPLHQGRRRVWTMNRRGFLAAGAGLSLAPLRPAWAAQIDSTVRGSGSASPAIRTSCAISSAPSPKSDFMLAFDVLATVYAAYLSAETGARVDLRPYLVA
jgi:hypothetical protein